MNTLLYCVMQPVKPCIIYIVHTIPFSIITEDISLNTGLFHLDVLTGSTGDASWKINNANMGVFHVK